MRTWRRFVGFILVFAILFSFPDPVLADRVSDLQQELSSISNELIQINGEYASISERANQLLQEVSRLTTTISTPGADLKSISRRLSEIQTEVSGLNARKTTLDSRKNYLAGRVGEIKNEITALQSVPPPPVVTPPPVVPPVVNPPPVISPPPIVSPPPVTNPPPVVQTNVSGEITNTIFPSTLFADTSTPFRMDFKNTGNTGWTFIAAMTVRYPDGHDVDYERISSYAAAGSNGAATWNPSIPPGNYRVIFGLWKDEQTALTRSYWMDFTVSAPPVVSPPPVTNPPPVITPPPVTPPVVNPPPVVPPSNRNPMITGTSVPAVVKTQSSAEFVMRYENTTVSGEYIAAATIRHPDGTEEDWAEVAIIFERSSMSWGFNSFYYPPGNYQIIFGIWKGNVAVTNSGWIAFKVQSDPPVSDPDDMDGTAEYNPNYGKVFVPIPIDDAEGIAEYVPSTPVPDDGSPRLFGEILKVELADDFSSRLLLDQGEEVTIKATIRSTGNKAGTFYVCIDQPCNQTLASGLENQKVYLQPGDVRTVSWRYKANSLGNNKLSIFLVSEEREIVGWRELEFDVLSAGYEVDDYGLAEEPKEDSFFTTLDEILLAADLFAAVDPLPIVDEGIITGTIVIKKSFDGLYRVYEGSKVLRFVWKVGGRAWDISDEAWSGYLKVERKIKYVAPSFKAGLKGQKYVIEKIGLHNFRSIEHYVGRRQIDGVAGKVFDLAGKRINPGDLIEIKSYERIDGLKKALSDRDLEPQIRDYLKHLEPSKKLVVIFKNRMPQKDIERFLDRIGDIRLEVINGID